MRAHRGFKLALFPVLLFFESGAGRATLLSPLWLYVPFILKLREILKANIVRGQSSQKPKSAFGLRAWHHFFFKMTECRPLMSFSFISLPSGDIVKDNGVSPSLLINVFSSVNSKVQFLLPLSGLVSSGLVPHSYITSAFPFSTLLTVNNTCLRFGQVPSQVPTQAFGFAGSAVKAGTASAMMGNALTNQNKFRSVLMTLSLGCATLARLERFGIS